MQRQQVDNDFETQIVNGKCSAQEDVNSPRQDLHADCNHNKTVAISWSGGKDCFLAYVTLRALQKASNQEILFVTFVPAQGDFLCHPLAILEEQSTQLQVSHEFLIIDEVNWEQGYFDALKFLQKKYQIKYFVTGEIFLDDQPQGSYWLKDILDQLHITLANPITPKPAQYMLDLLAQHQITARTTGMKQQFYHPDFLGQPITWKLLEQTNLTQLKNFGWYGENGEYHTVVTQYENLIFAPEFPERAFTKQQGEVIGLDLDSSFHLLTSHQRVSCFP